ncbi:MULTISPECIES: hypothetical protein [unclassified Nonomuraea]|uniref:hypothetical protein n=1 Tax=unclassified Nonomuraea TaxID=2593643 RepID=UPI0033CB54BF
MASHITPLQASNDPTGLSGHRSLAHRPPVTAADPAAYPMSSSGTFVTTNSAPMMATVPKAASTTASRVISLCTRPL